MAAPNRESTQVVVIGAGYAGISAARDLDHAGIDVVVLEASDRVGGRVHTDRTDIPIDLGGMWLGAGHTRFSEMAASASVTTYPTPSHGDALLRDGGEWHRYDPHRPLPPLGPVATAMFASVAWRLDRLAERIDLRAPWSSADASRLDSITVSSWLRTAAPYGPVRRLIDANVHEVLCADPSMVSMLALLTYIKSSGGLEALISTDGGAQQDLLIGGADGPIRHVAAELGDRIRLDSPVERIDQRGDHIVISGPTATITAERVIVAMPPTLAGRIRYEPVMPPSRDALTQQMPMGAVWKIFAVYDTPFWRDAGLSGESIDLRSPITATFDASPPIGPGLLCTLVGGSRARRLDSIDESDRRRLVLDHFASVLGARALRPVDYRERSWASQIWSRGGYSGYTPPGVLSTLGRAIRTPVGRIHWAGTETAIEFQGYIEGAIRSGERAAAEVAATLGDHRTGRSASAPDPTSVGADL